MAIVPVPTCKLYVHAHNYIPETDSDSDNETDPMDEFTANKWRLGDRVNRDNFVFTGNNGIKVDIPENPSPLDFIAIFLTDEFFETVTYQTNLYATSYLRSHRISPHSGPPPQSFQEMARGWNTH